MKRLLVIFFALISIQLSSQVVYFFQDGTDQTFYDQGLVDVANIGESEFETTHPPCCPEFNDKVPCSTISYEGNSSLRFSYTSSDNGNWSVMILRNDWSSADISEMDSISFYVYCEEGIGADVLPLIGVRAVHNSGSSEDNTPMYSLNEYNNDIAANTWSRIKFPLSAIFNDENNSNLDFNQAKAIVFQQSESNNNTRTILIDEISAFKYLSEIPEVENLVLDAYDSHVELKWDSPAESLTFNVYASYNEEESYELVAQSLNETSFLDFFPSNAKNKTIYYKVTTVNQDNESEPVVESTIVKEFTDDELLEMVQEQTFRYFWEGAHQATGLALERSNGSTVTVASGASGMSLMTMIVAYERNWRDRSEIINRVLTMLRSLQNFERFHGAFAHWYNANTGKVENFSQYDDGGDLVETAYLAIGLISVKNYFTGDDVESNEIRTIADDLWREIEWDWYTNNEDVLYWHWSPNYDWEMNMPIRAYPGWNEALVTYLVAASAPVYSISKSVYESGWAGNGAIVNPRTFYEFEINHNIDWGGQAFWTQYSFLGINPRGLEDQFGDYWLESSNAVNIHVEYAKDNPLDHRNYSDSCWGITASADPYLGYAGHWPNSDLLDNGTISPTGAIGNYPFYPEAALKALKYFYRTRGKELWGKYGFYGGLNDNMDKLDHYIAEYEARPNDFTVHYNPSGHEGNTWIEEAYIGIDQGPMVIMLENYRTELLWKTVMRDPDIQFGLNYLGFDFNVGVSEVADSKEMSIYPNPSNGSFTIDHKNNSLNELINVEIYTIDGKLKMDKQYHFVDHISINTNVFNTGMYLVKIKTGTESYSQRISILK